VEDARGIERRLIAGVPVLGDLDLQPLRWKLRYSLRARRALRQSASADVALINTQSCGLLAAARMRAVPTVISIDATGRQLAALEYWRPRTRKGLLSELPTELLERRAYRRAALVLAWSQWAAASLRHDYHVPPERIAVIHPGIDVARWDLRRGPRAEGPLRILFVGTNTERKGLRTLLTALPLIGREVELHVVTCDNDLDLPPLPPSAVVHRGLAPSSDELLEQFARAGVFVLPTLADTMGWVIVEAMAAGLPVIATKIAAIPEILGDAGILIAPNDPSELARALHELASDPVSRAALGERARARARRHFNQSEQNGLILTALRRASGASASSPEGASPARPVARPRQPVR
jgi:glycosyltransferase involved in cell wall biosynthesis